MSTISRQWYATPFWLTRGWLVRLNELLQGWHDRTVQRRTLVTLDDRTLRDLGLSRADVEREASKPFWRP